MVFFKVAQPKIEMTISVEMICPLRVWELNRSTEACYLRRVPYTFMNLEL